jgi:hypothetical protein
VFPGARTHGARKEDAEGGEAKAALALLGSGTPVEDADTAMGVFGKVAVGGFLLEKERGGRGRGGVDQGGCGALT